MYVGWKGNVLSHLVGINFYKANMRILMAFIPLVSSKLDSFYHYFGS